LIDFHRHPDLAISGKQRGQTAEKELLTGDTRYRISPGTSAPASGHYQLGNVFGIFTSHSVHIRRGEPLRVHHIFAAWRLEPETNETKIIQVLRCAVDGASGHPKATGAAWAEGHCCGALPIDTPEVCINCPCPLPRQHFGPSVFACLGFRRGRSPLKPIRAKRLIRLVRLRHEWSSGYHGETICPEIRDNYRFGIYLGMCRPQEIHFIFVPVVVPRGGVPIAACPAATPPSSSQRRPEQHKCGFRNSGLAGSVGMLRVTRHWGGTLKMNGAGGLRPPACALTLAVGVTPVPKPKLAHSISATMGNATAMQYWQALCAKRPHGARSGHSLTHLGV
jgi:hypothetical protein